MTGVAKTIKLKQRNFFLLMLSSWCGAFSKRMQKTAISKLQSARLAK